ncbi:amino acid adenylation domain-containing protein [Streptomyces sp. NPDC093018]|uniref:amino acid adenylation domain-containing protein n=1 Tax=Streptomyces sp. NPDC093018 TaxID=3155067 RepID=UPI00342D68C2
MRHALRRLAGMTAEERVAFLRRAGESTAATEEAAAPSAEPAAGPPAAGGVTSTGPAEPAAEDGVAPTGPADLVAEGASGAVTGEAGPSAEMPGSAVVSAGSAGPVAERAPGTAGGWQGFAAGSAGVPPGGSGSAVVSARSAGPTGGAVTEGTLRSAAGPVPAPAGSVPAPVGSAAGPAAGAISVGAAPPAATSPVATSPSAPAGVPVPASPGQAHQLYLDRLWTGDGAPYVVPFALRLTGVLSVAVLRRALADVVGRHPVLACRFRFEDGIAMAVPGAPPELSVVESPVGEEAAFAYAQERARLRFDLAQGPVVRNELISIAPQDHLLLWIVHHIAADGWSVGVLIEELSAAYRARLAGAEPELPPLTLQFTEFADWQWRRLDAAGDRIEAQRARLAGAGAAFVPTDHERPAVQTFDGRSVPFRLPDRLAADLRALARERGVTLFPVMLAALHTLVARYSGLDDAVTGVVVSGRARPGTEALIGPFANTLPMRIDSGGGPRFGALVDQVQAALVAVLADQDLPFGSLVQRLGGARDTTRNPLYQVLFSMGSLPLGDAEVAVTPELALRPVSFCNNTARLDLELTVEQSGTGLGGRLDYNSDLYDASTAERLLERYTTLLTGIAAEPDLPIGRYPLEPEDARSAALREAAAAARPAIATTFGELFARQVALRPNAPAVRCAGAVLSYAELDAASDAVAAAVRERVRGAEPVVAVGTGRTIELLPAVLGIWKAGAVYLPLELEYPAERLARLLTDSGARLLLTAGAELPDFQGLVLPAPPPSLDVRALPDRDLAPDPAPEDPDRLAYIMYTSGSTGHPKGIAVTHRSLGNFLASMAELDALRADDTTLALASLPFDGSVIELFLPPAVGAAVTVCGRADARDADRLAALLRGVTVQHGTPSTWRMLLDAGADLSGLRSVLSGGEALPLELARELRAAVGDVWNLYGPAETTVYSLVRRWDGTAPLIGPPIAGTTAHVLDAELRPVPTGVLGELFLGGAGLARGYLGEPELTAERFVRHPVTGERLYRTGDLFRRHADGSLTCHGRTDHQLKIRGHRIEPDEVAEALERDDRVREAVVLGREFGDGELRLVAFVRLADGVRGSEAELRGALAARLPAYLVPARIVAVPEFPHNSSGKVDRRALAVRDLADTVLDGDAGAADPPATPTQEWLARLWAELLERERVGVREDFFGAGGHSLLAVRMLHRVAAGRGAAVGLAAFLAEPTVEALAALVDEESATGELERRVDAMSDAEVAALLAELDPPELDPPGADLSGAAPSEVDLSEPTQEEHPVMAHSSEDEAYQRFLLVAHGHTLFNAVVAGLELDVFGHLSAHPGATLDELADQAGTAPHKMRILLASLCAIDLLTRTDGRYGNAPLAERLLAPRGPESWRNIFLSRHRTDYAGMAHTTQALRSGTNDGLKVHAGEGDSVYERLGADPETEAILHRSIAAFAHQEMQGLLRTADLEGTGHLLDVGGGSGAKAAAIAGHHPGITVTVFDLPSVTRLAARELPPGVDGRVRFQPGDMFTDPFPAGMDTILFSSVLDVFDAQRVETLLAKAYDALGPGGRVLIYSCNTAPDEAGGVIATSLSLFLNVIATGEGMAYPVADYERMLRKAGFDQVTAVGGLPMEHAMITAVKH